MRFEFATATRIVFGEGAAATLPDLVRTFGARPLVVTGASADRTAWLVSALAAETLAVPGEPTVDLVRNGAHRVREAACDVVVALGGGSAIDAGKAVAAVATNGGEPLDFLEVIGKGCAMEAAPLPFIAVPTTAGTGSEVTRNAVLASPQHGVKASLRSPMMLPKVALVDPELTYSLPPAVTAFTGLDALTQLIEPYVSVRANPLTDSLCADGIARAAGALRRAYHNGADPEARREMALASLLGGLALANAGLGVVHGFASPLGGSWDAPHGALCAALLPHGMAANIAALRARAPRHPALDRYDAIARQLTGRNQARAEDGVEWVRALCAELNVPPLRHWGIAQSDLPAVVEKAAHASSMKANPLPLTGEELLAAVSAAW
ncbi:MAG TPA: iron-containing alcohol dehydrogenase [Terracidiphilus sp.]|nr:iron-containing alcohol dehydrogenase [Terracidiphilus sp.]